MNEVKTPKKPLIFYYGIAMVVLLLLNMLVMPLITQHQVEEVDYGTFIKMTENKEIGQVEIEDNQICLLYTSLESDKLLKKLEQNFIRRSVVGRLRSEIFIQQFNDIAGFRKHFEIPLAEQGAEDDECNAAVDVVFLAAPLPQMVKFA